MENKNKPAFATNGRMHEDAMGLTKREYASIKFMQSLVAKWTHDGRYVPAQGGGNISDLAKHSIELADELFKQLENG